VNASTSASKHLMTLKCFGEYGFIYDFGIICLRRQVLDFGASDFMLVPSARE